MCNIWWGFGREYGYTECTRNATAKRKKKQQHFWQSYTARHTNCNLRQAAQRCLEDLRPQREKRAMRKQRNKTGTKWYLLYSQMFVLKV